MKKIKLIKIISSISTLGILGLTVGVNATSCAEKTGDASVYAFLDTEALVKDDNSSILLHVYEVNVPKWVTPKIEFTRGTESSNGFVWTKNSQVDKLGTYKIKAFGVTTGTWNIKVSVVGFKKSVNLIFEVKNPPQIKNIKIQGLDNVSGTTGVANNAVATYQAMADDKLLTNSQVTWTIDGTAPVGVSIDTNGHLVFSNQVQSGINDTITIKCVLNSVSSIFDTKAVGIKITNAPQLTPTNIAIVGPATIKGYSGEANDNAAHFIVHDQNNYWIKENISWAIAGSSTGVEIENGTDGIGILKLKDDATTQQIDIKATYTSDGGVPITSANFSITITIEAIPQPSVYKSADGSDWEGRTSGALDYDQTITKNDLNEDCYAYASTNRNNHFSATNLIVPSEVALPGAVATPCKTWLKVNDGGDAAFTGSSLSGSLTFAEGTKQIGNDKATNDDSGLFSGGNNININNLILPSSLEKVGKSTFWASSGINVTTPTLNLPKKLTNIGKNAFSWIKTQLIVGNYDTLPDVNVDSEAFADVTNITAEPSGYPKGYVMNIGSVSNSAFYDWLKSKGLPEYYFILPDVK